MGKASGLDGSVLLRYNRPLRHTALASCNITFWGFEAGKCGLNGAVRDGGDSLHKLLRVVTHISNNPVEDRSDERVREKACDEVLVLLVYVPARRMFIDNAFYQVAYNRNKKSLELLATHVVVNALLIGQKVCKNLHYQCR